MSFRLKRAEAKRRSEASLAFFSDDLGMTEQSHRDSCDINVIMKRYEQTGIAPGTYSLPSYDDFTGVTDYQSACNAVIQAEQSFKALPAKVRAEFDNNPQKLLVALDDPKNRERFEKLGFLTPKVAPDATLKDVVEAVRSTKVSPKKKPSGTPEG